MKNVSNQEKIAMQQVVRRYYEELFNQGRVEIVAELLAENYQNHSPGSPEQSRGRDGVVDVVRALRQAFPDLHYRIEDQIISDDAVAVRTTMTGTHRGSWFGLAPTGRSFQVEQMTIEHFAGGKIVAHHRLTDLHGLLAQLGPQGKEPT